MHPKNRIKWFKTFLTRFAIAIPIILLIAYKCPSSADTVNKNHFSKASNVSFACWLYVRDSVLNGSSDVDLVDNEYVSRKVAENTWVTTILVRGRNAFNAPAVSSFTCKIVTDESSCHIMGVRQN